MTTIQLTRKAGENSYDRIFYPRSRLALVAGLFLANLVSFGSVQAQAVSQAATAGIPEGTPVLIMEPVVETLDPPLSQNSFSFIVMGDSQNFQEDQPDGGLQKAVSAIADQRPALVVSVGDLIDNCDPVGSCPAKFEAWKRTILPILGKTLPVMGNHDRSGNKEADQIWQEAFNLPTSGPKGYEELAYAFDYGNARFIMLNSEVPEKSKINGDQRRWLEEKLKDNRKAHVFVFFHQPAFPQAPFKKKQSLDTHEKNRDDLWEIIDKYDVTAVFNGHEHLYSRLKVDQEVFEKAKNDVFQINVGYVDANGRDALKETKAEKISQDPGYFKVSVEGEKVNAEFFNLENQVRDKFLITK